MKKLSVIIITVIFMCLTVLTVSAANEWDIYDYSRFDNSTYIYDIGGHLSVDLEKYNVILKQMKSDYDITYTFFIVDDYPIIYDDDTVWDLAAVMREKVGYSRDYISVVITTGPFERDFAVYTLGQGQQVMNDSYVDGMWEAIFEYLKKDDWDGALETFVDLAVKMTDSYIYDTPSVKDESGNIIYYINEKNIPVLNIILFGGIVGLVVSLIAVFAELAKHKPVKTATNADYYVREENVRMNIVQDQYSRSNEVRVKVRDSSSGGGGGGGRSGGSSFGGGSSGSSGGGRSGRF